MLTNLPEVKEEFSFRSLRKKTAGDGRNAIRLLFSASSSIDACDKIYSLP